MGSLSRHLGVSTALAIALSMAVAACSGATSSVPPASAPASSVGVAPTTAAADPVKLVIWTFSAGQEEEYGAVDRAFMAAHPNITIEQVPWPDDWLAKARAAVAAKKGPDVMAIGGGVIIAGLQQGFVPLQGRVTDEQNASVRYIDMSYSPDGNLYALPVQAATSAFLYNKTLFAKAGLDPEKPPQDWAELVSACAALRSAGIEPIGAGWKDGYGLDYFHWNGGVHGLTDEKRASWNSIDLPMTDPGITLGVKAAQELDRLDCFQNGADARVFYNEVKESFDAGESAIIMWPAGHAGTSLAESEKAFGEGNLGVFQIPTFPGGVRSDGVESGPSQGYLITSFSEHQDEAWEYISFLTSKEAQTIRWEQFGVFPNNNLVDTTTDDPVVRKMLELTAIPGNFALWMNTTDQAMTPLRQNAARLVHGQADVETTFKEMDDIQRKVAGAFNR